MSSPFAAPDAEPAEDAVATRTRSRAAGATTRLSAVRPLRAGSEIANLQSIAQALAERANSVALSDASDDAVPPQVQVQAHPRGRANAAAEEKLEKQMTDLARDQVLNLSRQLAELRAGGVRAPVQAAAAAERLPRPDEAPMAAAAPRPPRAAEALFAAPDDQIALVDANLRHQVPRLPRFSGEAEGDRPVAEVLHAWLAELEALASICGWNDEARLTMLLALCTGKARDRLAVEAASANSFAGAREVLVRAFANAPSKAAERLTAELELRRLRQRNAETLNEFMPRFIACVARVIRSGPELDAAEINRALLTAVRPHLHAVINDVEDEDMPLSELEGLLRREEQRYLAFRVNERPQGSQQRRGGNRQRQFRRPFWQQERSEQRNFSAPNGGAPPHPGAQRQWAPRQHRPPQPDQQRGPRFQAGRGGQQRHQQGGNRQNPAPVASVVASAPSVAEEAEAGAGDETPSSDANVCSIAVPVDGAALPRCRVEIAGREFTALLDSGAQVSIATEHAAQALRQAPLRKDDPRLATLRTPQLRSFDGKCVPVKGSVQGRLSIATDHAAQNEIAGGFFIVDKLEVGDLILGCDMLAAANVSLHFRSAAPPSINAAAAEEGSASEPATEQVAINPELPARQKTQIVKLIDDFPQIWALDPTRPGRTTATVHRIPTVNLEPTRRARFKSWPPERLQLLDKFVDEMLEAGLIRASNSPNWSPVHFVKKADGSPRLVVDFRVLNEVTLPEHFVIPRVNDILSALEGCQWFSTLDLASGYWQVPLAEEDAWKTAFLTPRGCFEFTVMPFGLRNAPATFQRLMSEVLRDLTTGVAVYIDDVLVFSRTWEEHLRLLRAVFVRLHNAGLRLRPKKCRIALAEVTYLGFRVCRGGILPSAEKARAVTEYPRPKSVTELRAFLGLVNYYARFVPAMSNTAAPLHDLLRANVKFAWEDRQEAAFVALKRALTNPPFLVYPDFTKPFLLQTDASDVGIGAILAQDAHNEGSPAESPGRRVITYISRRLNPAERNYSAYEKETLAVVWAIRSLSQYLLGREFSVVTDHAALRQLLAKSEPDGRVARWLAALQEFRFTVLHRPGTSNSNADALSRGPAPAESQVTAPPGAARSTPSAAADDLDDERIYPGGISKAPPEPLGEIRFVAANLNEAAGGKAAMVAAHSEPRSEEGTVSLPQTLQAFRAAQRADPELAPIIDALTNARESKSEDNNDFVLIVGTLFSWPARDAAPGALATAEENPSTGPKLVVPAALRRSVMDAFHTSPLGAHMGRNRLLAALANRFTWPRMGSDVREYVSSCLVCARTKSAQAGMAPLQPIFSAKPFEIIGIDLFGPFPRSRAGNVMVLTIVDHFTHWIELVPLPSAPAPVVAEALYTNWVCRYGCPVKIISDQGPQFTGLVFQRLAERLQIRHSFTSPYHPQSNGFTERPHRVIKAALQALTSASQRDWDVYIPAVAFALRSTKIEGLGLAPCEILFGHQTRYPLEAATALPVRPVDAQDRADRVAALAEALPTIHEQVAAWQHLSKTRRKIAHDARASMETYALGSMALVHQSPQPPRPGMSSKLMATWSRPMRIVRNITPVTYELEDPTTGQRTTAHVQRLRPWRPLPNAEAHGAQAALADVADPQDAGPVDEHSVPQGSPAAQAAPAVARPLNAGTMIIARDAGNIHHGFLARVLGPQTQEGVPVHAYNSHNDKVPLAKRRFFPSHYRWTGDGNYVESFTNSPPQGYLPYELVVLPQDIIASSFNLEAGRVPEHVLRALPQELSL